MSDPTAYGADPAPPKDIRGSSSSSHRSQWFPIDRRCSRALPIGGDDRVGQWLDERIDLERVYAEIWKDAAPAYLFDIAVFCDSDDTHTASIKLLRLCPA